MWFPRGIYRRGRMSAQLFMFPPVDTDAKVCDRDVLLWWKMRRNATPARILSTIHSFLQSEWIHPSCQMWKKKSANVTVWSLLHELIYITEPSSGIFHRYNSSGRTIALESTQSLKEMSTRDISLGVKAAGA